MPPLKTAQLILGLKHCILATKPHWKIIALKNVRPAVKAAVITFGWLLSFGRAGWLDGAKSGPEGVNAGGCGPLWNRNVLRFLVHCHHTQLASTEDIMAWS
ncbi:hypothetical protein SRHO_G00204830 [Serrasalmus rhombeus]